MFAVRIFSAYAVTSAEKITLATMTNWRSCIFLVRDGPFPHAWSTPPGKQQWRHRSRDDFSYLMRAPPARRRPLGNNATAPQSTRRLAQFLRRRCCRPRRRLTLAGKYQGRGRRHSYVAQLFRRHWFALRQDEKCRRVHNGGGSPKTALVWAVSRMFVFLPPGGQFHRSNNEAGPANAAARPISPPPVASSPRDKLIPE